MSGARLPLQTAVPERSLPALDALLSSALQEGPSVILRRLEAAQQEANAKAARAPMLPYVYASLSAGMILEQRSEVADGTRTLEALLYNAGISQPVYHWGALAKAYEMSKLQAVISGRNIVEARRLLAIDIRRRYFDVVIAAGDIQATRREITRLESELADLRQQQADGFVSASGVSSVDTNLGATKRRLNQQTAAFDDLVRSLRRLAGLDAHDDVLLVEALPAPSDAISPMLNELSAYANTPPVRLQNLDDSIRAEELNRQIIAKRLWPKFGLSGTLSQDNRNPDNNVLGPKQLLTTWGAFATVNWTVFDGFATSAAKTASVHRLQALRTDRDLAERELSDERRGQIERLKNSWDALRYVESILATAQSGIEKAQRDFDAGWIPFREVDKARETAASSLRSANAARADFYMALVNYLSSRGADPALEARSE